MLLRGDFANVLLSGLVDLYHVPLFLLLCTFFLQGLLGLLLRLAAGMLFSHYCNHPLLEYKLQLSVPEGKRYEL